MDSHLIKSSKNIFLSLSIFSILGCGFEASEVEPTLSLETDQLIYDASDKIVIDWEFSGERKMLENDVIAVVPTTSIRAMRVDLDTAQYAGKQYDTMVLDLDYQLLDHRYHIVAFDVDGKVIAQSEEFTVNGMKPEDSDFELSTNKSRLSSTEDIEISWTNFKEEINNDNKPWVALVKKGESYWISSDRWSYIVEQDFPNGAITLQDSEIFADLLAHEIYVPTLMMQEFNSITGSNSQILLGVGPEVLVTTP